MADQSVARELFRGIIFIALIVVVIRRIVRGKPYVPPAKARDDIRHSPFGDIIIYKYPNFGLLGPSHEVLIPCEYEYLEALKQGIFEARKPGFNGIINEQNKVLLDCKGPAWMLRYSETNKIIVTEGYMRVYAFDYVLGTTTKLPYNNVTTASDGRYESKRLYRTIVGIQPDYDDYSLTNNTLSRYKGKWGLITPGGTEIIPNDYDFLEVLTDKYYRVAIGDFSFTYDENNDELKATGAKWGVIDKSNKIVVPIEYDWVWLDKKDDWMVNTGGSLELWDEYGEWDVRGGKDEVFV